MKILINDNVFGWRMTGLIGKYGKWFIGFSKKPAADDEKLTSGIDDLIKYKRQNAPFNESDCEALHYLIDDLEDEMVNGQNSGNK